MAKKKSVGSTGDGYDRKKGAWKLAKNAAYVLLAGLASVYGENPYYMALAPLLVGLENYLKHGTNLLK